MHLDLESLFQATAVFAALTLSGCSSSDPAPADPTVDAGPATEPTSAGTADLPATGSEADVKAWLAKGDYKTGSWTCESAPHAARSPSAHGANRICSNATLRAHGAGEFPVGASAVKELYSGTTVIGHAVYRKLSAGAGESFYWYEDINGSVVANGLGNAGSAKSVCVGCHSAAGSDADHSGHDLVYTQVE